MLQLFGLSPDMDMQESLQFWSRATSIQRSQFQKSYVDKRTGKKKTWEAPAQDTAADSFGTGKEGIRGTLFQKNTFSE